MRRRTKKDEILTTLKNFSYFSKHQNFWKGKTRNDNYFLETQAFVLNYRHVHLNTA